jgi:dihydropteroate synthase
MHLELRMRDYTLTLGKHAVVMGILNVTPDSFYDGGRYADPEAALAGAIEMTRGGAEIIDVGAESTRPKAAPVTAEEEIVRMRPVVKALLEAGGVPVSIDTRKSLVAREMLGLGAHMINDVSGLSFDPDMARVIRDFDVPVVIMHMRGGPENMQDFTDYDDVVGDVKREIAEKINAAEKAGIRSDRIIIDPGIGFSKTAGQCLELIARLDEFLDLGKPILLGPSRKSFIGKTLGLASEDRLEATVASCIVGVSKGAAIVRVHDVDQVARALRMFEALTRHERGRQIGVPGKWNG